MRRLNAEAAAAGAPDQAAPRDGGTPPAAIVFGRDGTVRVDGRTVGPLDALKLVDVAVHQVARPGVQWMVDHRWVADFDVAGTVRRAAGGS